LPNLLIGEVAGFIKDHKLRPPVIIIVGEVAAASRDWSWFDRRPLFGQRILITRPAHQTEDLCLPLRELGAEVLLQPAIEITPPANWALVDAAIHNLPQQQRVIVFSSSNGVEFFLDRLRSLGKDMRALAHAQIAAIGPGTAAALEKYSLQADIVPAEYRAEALAGSLIPTGATSYLLIRTNRGRDVLADQLLAAGANVEQIVVYESRDIEHPAPEIATLIAGGKIDWITVTSSAIGKSLVNMFGEDLRRAKLASISPITSASLRDLGYEPAVEATEYTMAGLVEAIRSAIQS
jgi:uroporphyrinogen III methyltransferase / synthase